MKKLLSTAALFAAGTAIANAATTTTTMLTLPSSNSDLAKVTLSSDTSSWSQYIGSPSNITATAVATDYAILLANNYTSGQWLWNVANLNSNDYVAGTEVAVVTQGDVVTGFSFNGRQAYGGEFVMTSVSLSSFVADGYTFSSLDNFSISFTFSGQSDATFSIYLYSSSSCTQLYSVTLGASASVSFTASTGYGDWSTLAGSLTGDETLIFVWNESSTGNKNTVSSLTSSISITTTAVPEPSAFGLLAGLSALAIVASRRRRSRRQVA